MGKRKSTTRKQAKKVKTTLDKTFACVFCNHENTISCKLDQDNKIGHLICSACAIQWSCAITALTEPIDIYSEWIDACDNVQAEVSKQPERDYERDTREDQVYDSDED
ncbi:transcription elongation factor 1 [Globomyces pollinis-pini]|nr:transcription elongation factor 1 [Globomyces pollinis-pini]